MAETNSKLRWFDSQIWHGLYVTLTQIILFTVWYPPFFPFCLFENKRPTISLYRRKWKIYVLSWQLKVFLFSFKLKWWKINYFWNLKGKLLRQWIIVSEKNLTDRLQIYLWRQDPSYHISSPFFPLGYIQSFLL